MSGPNPPSESQAMEQTVPAEIGPLATRPAGAEPLVRGMAIGRYTVLDRIGAGGMGVVYSAFDPELDRKVALKVLHSSGSGSVGGTHGRNRLLREAQAMAKLHHPNVITVHDVGTFGDRVFVAMEFVDGQTLREWHGDGVHDWPEIIDVFVRAGRGLAAAHAVGLVHRDFKPDNVLVGNDGRVLVMDFGLARQAGASGTPEPGTPRVQASSPVPEGLLTRTGTVLGTPAYMAPEQHTSGTIGPATDQFSFCVALYEALYGERPFSGNSVASLALAVLEGKPRRPRRDAPAPVWLFGVLERGLLADPHERFPSMDALLAELQRDPPTSGRPMLTVAIALGVAGLIVGGYLWTRPDPIARCDEERRQFTPLVDDDRERAMEAAFEASGIRHAPRAWQSASQRLMGYDAEWNEQWRMACEAGYARPADAAPMLERRACLETLRGEARSVVDSLSLVDQGTVDIAVDAAQDLAVPGDCALPPSQRPLTLDPSKGELARAIAEARTAVRLGRWREAADRLSGFVVTPVPIDDAALEAELLTLHGRAEQHLDRVDAGRASLRRAVLAASIAGNSRLERDAWLAIAAGLAHSVHDVDQAWPTLVATEAAIVRDGDDVAARRQWLVAHGDIHSALGRHREALDRYDRATTSIRAGTDPTVVAALSARRCIALSAIELPTDAAPACSSAVDTFAEELGDTHPRVAAALAELGIAQLAEGDEGAAAASFERARIALDPEDAFVVRADTVLGPLAPLWPHEQVPSTNAGLLARVLDRIGLAERSRRRFGPAARAHAAAAGLLARTRTGSVGYPLVNLGVALLDLGRPADALAQLQRGVDELRDDLPDDHPDLPIAELDLANALASTGQWTDAGALYQDVLDVWEERLPPDHPLLAYALTGLARARLELDDASAAIDPLERAYELREDAREDGTNLAETAWLLARALLGSGSDEARAIELATRALATIGAPAITDPLELRRVLSGGALVGVTDRLTPASLPLTDRTPLGIPVGR